MLTMKANFFNSTQLLLGRSTGWFQDFPDTKLSTGCMKMVQHLHSAYAHPSEYLNSSLGYFFS